MIFSFCCFSLGCSRICLATRWRKPFDSLAWFGFFWYLKVQRERGRWQESSSNAASFLSPCGFVSPSCGSPPFPLPLCCQIRCSLLTKQKHVAFSAFVLCLCYALLFAVASLFSCLFFHFGGRIFNDLVG